MEKAVSMSPGTEPKTRLGRFFFAKEVPYGLAVMRILMPLVLLLVMAPRWFHAREFFSADGAIAPLSSNYGYPELLPVFPGYVAVALASALVFFLITSSIGWCTRFSLAAATLLYVYLNVLDSLSSLTKYTVIASHAMLLLSLSHCGAIWSVDSWLKKKKSGPAPLLGFATRLPRFPAWPRRLVQLMIGLVYFGAALTKMHTPVFFSGDQLRYWMLTNVNHENPIGEYLSFFPALLVIGAYVSIVWEVLFVFIGWRGLGRFIVVAFGVAFHVLTTMTLGLYIFPMVCITIYFSFLDEADVRRFARLFRRAQRKMGWVRNGVASGRSWISGFRIPRGVRCPSPVAFGSLAIVVMLVGVEAEYLLDPYGIRRPEGPYALEPLEPEYVAQLLTPSGRIRNPDKFLSFNVGTQLMSGLLVNSQYEFRQGDCLVAQCTHCPPHEDMWVECNLHDAHDRVLDRVGQVVTREMLRSNFIYRLTEALEPGEYSLVVKMAGEEITRRKITLKPRIDAPVAN